MEVYLLILHDWRCNVTVIPYDSYGLALANAFTAIKAQNLDPELHGEVGVQYLTEKQVELGLIWQYRYFDNGESSVEIIKSYMNGEKDEQDY